jgi:hypothetical protein
MARLFRFVVVVSGSVRKGEALVGCWLGWWRDEDRPHLLTVIRSGEQQRVERAIWRLMVHMRVMQRRMVPLHSKAVSCVNRVMYLTLRGFGGATRCTAVSVGVDSTCRPTLLGEHGAAAQCEERHMQRERGVGVKVGMRCLQVHRGGTQRPRREHVLGDLILEYKLLDGTVASVM